MTLPNAIPDYNQVRLTYFARVVRELLEAGKLRTALLMIENDVYFDDLFATWKRSIL